MREIIFRGKSPITKEWVYGDLFQHGEQRFIMTGGHNIEVDPESVGQFTGLTDKNDVKIFEGDIIKSTRSDTIGKVGYYPEEGAFMVLFNASSGYHVGYLGEINMSVIEIISNIYDNPELIEDGDADEKP